VRLLVIIIMAILTGPLMGQGNYFSDDGGDALSASHKGLPADPVHAAKDARTSISPTVNSVLDEVNPVLSADGSTLFFARKNSGDNLGGKFDPQDIWVSTFDSVSGWSKSMNAGRQVNSEGADNLTAISADNNILYFYSAKDWRGKFQFRTKTRNGWSAARDLGLEIVNESRFLESCMSSDGEVILFTAKTPGNIRYQKNYDERDIYISVQTAPGVWTTPVNAGTMLNTPGDEFSPWLAPDNRTLYFATNGRAGYGNADIFVSRRIGDSWTNWTTPENLGTLFNSSSFDAYFRLRADGETAVFISHYLTAGKGDIFEARVPLLKRPDVQNPQNDSEFLPRLDPIWFEATAANVRSNDLADLRHTATLLNDNQDLVLEIHGYTDNQGTRNGLMNLSEKRCRSIRNILIAEGVSAKQLKLIPHGANKPISLNDNEGHRSKNRRVEFRLMRQ
jgi:outer membrane protein OmpA-like peptidoglycan-associated protein